MRMDLPMTSWGWNPQRWHHALLTWVMRKGGEGKVSRAGSSSTCGGCGVFGEGTGGGRVEKEPGAPRPTHCPSAKACGTLLGTTRDLLGFGAALAKTCMKPMTSNSMSRRLTTKPGAEGLFSWSWPRLPFGPLARRARLSAAPRPPSTTATPSASLLPRGLPRPPLPLPFERPDPPCPPPPVWSSPGAGQPSPTGKASGSVGSEAVASQKTALSMPVMYSWRRRRGRGRQRQRSRVRRR